MKLALGTVQFGLDYGVSNESGQVPAEEVNAILTTALNSGINTLDCAAAYGSSEQRVGENRLSQKFTLVTKIPSLTEDITREKINLAHLLKQSLFKLKRDKVDTLLLHNADDLITHVNRDEIYQQLITSKQQGLVNSIGISVYAPAQLETIMKSFEIDVVQIPINFLDQRFLKANFLQKLQQRDIKVHCRSVFLQGLLLMKNSQIPSYFQPYQNTLQAFYQLAKQLKCTKLTLALAIVVKNPLINNIVVGCCSKEQLEEIIISYHQAKNISLSPQILEQFSSDEIKLINPSIWCLND